MVCATPSSVRASCRYASVPGVENWLSQEHMPVGGQRLEHIKSRRRCATRRILVRILPNLGDFWSSIARMTASHKSKHIRLQKYRHPKCLTGRASQNSMRFDLALSINSARLAPAATSSRLRRSRKSNGVPVFTRSEATESAEPNFLS